MKEITNLREELRKEKQQAKQKEQSLVKQLQTHQSILQKIKDRSNTLAGSFLSIILFSFINIQNRLCEGS